VAWAASHPGITAPIVGARSAAQADAALDAMDFAMTPELRCEISALSPEPPLATDRRDEHAGLFLH